MAIPYNLEIGSVYNIPMLANAILGSSYQNATIKGFLDYDSAIAISDVSGLHHTVLSLLPVGTPPDPTKLIYIKLQTNSGQIAVIAANWIAAAPTLVNSTAIQINMTGVNLSDIPKISAILNANGYKSFTVTTV